MESFKEIILEAKKNFESIEDLNKYLEQKIEFGNFQFGGKEGVSVYKFVRENEIEIAATENDSSGRSKKSLRFKLTPSMSKKEIDKKIKPVQKMISDGKKAKDEYYKGLTSYVKRTGDFG